MNTNRLISLLPDMAIFVLVVESGSFTAAAERLSMTPSAVSRQISRLEKALDVRLIERTTRRQVVTEEGVAAYDKCREMVDCATDVGQIAQQSTQASGHLTISAPKAYSKIVLEPLILRFLALYPEIQIHFKVTDTFLNPIRDDVDLVFRLSDQLIEGLVSKPVQSVALKLCASPQYLSDNIKPVHPNDLTRLSCLALGEYDQDNRWIFTKGDHKVRVEVKGRYTVNHSEMRLRAVKEGLGIGLFPDFVIQNALSSGEVIEVLPDWHVKQKYQGIVSMQYAQNKYMPTRLRSFIDFISSELSDL